MADREYQRQAAETLSTDYSVYAFKVAKGPTCGHEFLVPFVAHFVEMDGEVETLVEPLFDQIRFLGDSPVVSPEHRHC